MNLVTGQPTFRCEYIRRSTGRQCGSYATIRVADGSYRCRHHRDPSDTPQRPLTPPVAVIRTKADAIRLVSWVTNMLALGRIKAAHGAAALRGISMWERVARRAETDAVERFEKLIEQQQELSKHLRKAIEAYEGEDGDRGEQAVMQAEELRSLIREELRSIGTALGAEEDRINA